MSFCLALRTVVGRFVLAFRRSVAWLVAKVQCRFFVFVSASQVDDCMVLALLQGGALTAYMTSDPFRA